MVVWFNRGIHLWAIKLNESIDKKVYQWPLSFFIADYINSYLGKRLVF